MKITLEPTGEFFRTDEGIPVRAWKGHTDQGTPIIAFVAAIATPEGADHEDLQRQLHTIPGPNIGQVTYDEAPSGEPG